jgi:hypothetical protein
MPQQQALPTWLQINNMNSPYQSGQGDSQTGFPYAGGGLNAGDYFDLTNDEASNASYATNGILYEGRYRYVQVDSGATAAYVKTGTVGYIRAGSTVKSVVTTNAGTGLTTGSYQIAANPGSGGGSGAIIAINVNNGAIVGSPTVVSGGFGYVSAPSFSLTALGGSGATVSAQLSFTPNIVTSADQVAAGTALALRPVVYLNSITPGNYGFIQELGAATVLGNAAIGTVTPAPAYVNAVASNNGTVTCTAGSGSPLSTTIGLSIDTPANSILFKTQLQYVPVVQD